MENRSVVASQLLVKRKGIEERTHRRFFQAMKLFCLIQKWWVNKTIHLSKLIEILLVLRVNFYICKFKNRERVGRFGRMALKHVKYHVWNELPVQVRCTILDAWGWCTGTTQRDGMGREEGRGFRMGNTCIPVVDSFWYLANLIQLCKV